MAHNSKYKQLVFTVKDRCRVCYTCVRECPVKAIRIINGQAEVMSERCIGCGNCVRVCSQEAKVYLKLTNEVQQLLQSDKPVAACLAPSFVAEFQSITDYRVLVGMVRALGFTYVTEVAFGADMVARSYKQKYENGTEVGVISSDCPAIVYYVEHFQPELVNHLAPFVSPMVASSRYLKQRYGADLEVVFIGPCIAKKAESDDVYYALTFCELREMFDQAGIHPKNIEPSDFDPPYAAKGAVFPISHGLLQNMEIADDLTKADVVVAEGRRNFMDALSEYAKGNLKVRHLELLCCEGCIMGPGMSKNSNKYQKRSLVSAYAEQKMKKLDVEAWEKEMALAADIDLSNSFAGRNRRLENPSNEKVAEVLFRMGKNDLSDYLDCGACGYDSCVEHAIAIVQGLAENEMCLPYSIEKLHQSVEKLNISNRELNTAREALKQSEKLAHMGQLSAGIAHELNNPLGVITMYSNLILDETTNEDLKSDLQLIVEQTERCRKIVNGLLNFARKNQVRLTETHLEKFVTRSLQSVVIPQSVEIKYDVNLNDPYLFVDADQMMQVLTNLEKNAIEAMPKGGVLMLKLRDKPDELIISVTDTGTGIAKENIEKLFTPFFTTKEVGKGTGLGLPLCYGIVKMHKGKISVHSNTSAKDGPLGTTFVITLPRNPEK